MNDQHAPPRVATRLLAAALPKTRRGDAVLGDLHEEFLGRTERGLWRARIWYTRQALAIALRYAGRSGTREGRRGQLDRGQRWSWEGFADELVFNIRYAVRRLVRSPGFTLVAIVSLGLGIGANTAMFSLVNAIVIRDLPFEDPESLVNVYGSELGSSTGSLSYPDYEDLAEGTTDVFSGISGMMFAFMQADVDDSGVEMLFGEAVTGNYFPLNGVQPALGRLISAEDHIARGAHDRSIIIRVGGRGDDHVLRRLQRPPHHRSCCTALAADGTRDDVHRDGDPASHAHC